MSLHVSWRANAHIRTVSLVFGLFLAFPPMPSRAQQVTFGRQGERLPVVALTTFRSTPGETSEAFVRRVGTFLARYSHHTGFEACAALIPRSSLSDSVSSGWIAPVTTNESHLGCVVVSDETVPTSAQPWATIHSHPSPGLVCLNHNDNVFLRGTADGSSLNGVDLRVRQPVWRVHAGVSSIDRQAVGTNYLVESGRVVRFGAGTSDQDLGPVAPSPLPRLAAVSTSSSTSFAPPGMASASMSLTGGGAQSP